MRLIPTVAGIILFFIMLSVASGAIMSEMARQNENKIIDSEIAYTVKDAMNNDEFSAITEKTIYYSCSDSKTFYMPYNRASDFAVIEYNGVKYGVTYDSEACSFQSAASSSTYTLDVKKGFEIIRYPFSLLTNETINETEAEEWLSPTDDISISAISAILYSTSDIVDTRTGDVILYKNLLTEQDMYMIGCAAASSMYKTNTDSNISLEVQNINAKEGLFSYVVTSDFKYPLQTDGEAVKEKQFIYE